MKAKGKYRIRKGSLAWFVRENRRALCMMLIIGLLLSCFAMAEAIISVCATETETYTVTATCNGRHKFVTTDGNEWIYYGYESVMENEPVSITFDNKGTEEVEDDVITEIKSELTSLGMFTITYYCRENYPHICNDGDARETATGTYPTPNRTVAVDPSVIPYGTEIVIDENTYIAEDCGGAIQGNRIDILVDTHEEALQKGIEYYEVFIK